MTLETKSSEVCQNAVLPRRVVVFFKVKENSQDMAFVNKNLSDKRFKTNEVIQRVVVLSETALFLRKKSL